MYIKLVKEWVSILRHRRCENHDLIQFADAFHEGVNSWSLDHIHIVILAFNLDRNGKVGLVQNLEAELEYVLTG